MCRGRNKTKPKNEAPTLHRLRSYSDKKKKYYSLHLVSSSSRSQFNPGEAFCLMMKEQ